MGITGGRRATKKGRASREREKRRKKQLEDIKKKPAPAKKKKRVTVLPTIQLKRQGETVTAAESERRSEERRKTATKTTILPTIQLKKKKTGLAALREKPTVAGKAARVATSLKTTANLGIILAGLLTAGTITAAGAAKAGQAVITRTVFKKAGTLAITRQVGRKIVERTVVGRSAAPVISGQIRAASYATNAKSIGLTKSFLIKAGLAVGAIGIVGTAVGTYPFAEFELAEATDKIGIAMFRASQDGDHQKVVELGLYMEEMLDEGVWEQIINKIPFANVMQSVRKNIAAALVSKDALRDLAIASAEKLAAGGESEFETARREGDEAARQRQLEERARDSEYFRLIREGKFEEAEELLQSELKGGE